MSLLEMSPEKLVCSGATLRCSQGSSPSTYQGSCVRVDIQGQPAATIQHFVPMKNVAPFGLCRSSSNPAVASANNTPQPCVPALASAWSPGAQRVELENQPALLESDKLMCNWAGTITVANAGQSRVEGV